MSATTAHVALGSNLGDREATLRSAVADLRAVDGVTVTAVSALYETAPIGGPDKQGPYLNAAASVETALEPLALLDLLQAIEAAHHRERVVLWGPRTLDLDLLLYGDVVMRSDRLTLPHPRLAERRFVLAPLADIAATARLPTTGARIDALFAGLPPATPADRADRVAVDWASVAG